MKNKITPKADSDAVKKKLGELFDEVFSHDGYGSIEVDMKILRRGQKEVILRCGKEYRFILDFDADNGAARKSGTPRMLGRVALSESRD